MLISAAVAVSAYLQALDYPFITDDTVYITNNYRLAGLRLTELWRLFTEPYNAYSEFLPLREFSYWLDISLFGLNPSAFRIHNILLYLFCLPLVYGTTSVLWRYFRPADATSAPWAAAVVTALFALHPSHAEAVVTISGRKDVLAALLSLLALWLTVRAKREQGLSAPHAAAALAALLAAMLSKATAVAVAPVIALLWVMFWLDIPAPHRRRTLLLWPFASLLLATCLALIFATITTARIPFYFGVEAVTRSLAVLGWLARLAVSPESRHFLYPVFEDPYLPVMVAFGVAILAAGAIGAVMFLRCRSLESFTLVAFTLICLPSLQLIPYGPPSLVSDRFVALAVWPAILLIIALAWSLKPVPRTALLLVIALPWSFQTIERPRDWRSFEMLADADLRAYPGYYMPAMYKTIGQLQQGLYREASETANSITAPEFRNITVKLVEAGYAVADAVSTGRPQKAITLLLELEPELKHPPVQAKWNSPIANLWGLGLFVVAIEWGNLAEQFPDNVLVRYNAGLRMLDTFRPEDAVVHLRAATESQDLPEYVRGAAFRNLGLALLNSGHVAEAEAPLRAALEQWVPDTRAYCLLSKVYRQTNRFEEAARAEAGCTSRSPNEKTTQ